MEVHIVQDTDTLKSIADRYKVRPEDIVSCNSNMLSDQSIVPGMELKIPEKHIINYRQNRNIKLILEDSGYRYYFTNTIFKPEIKKKDTLLKIRNISFIASILRKCLIYRSMQETAVKKASGISNTGRKTRQKPDYLTKTAEQFRNKYIIKEQKPVFIDPFLEHLKPSPPIPDIPFDEMHWISIQLNDEEGGFVKNERFELYIGDKKIVTGITDAHGMAKMMYMKMGDYDFCFPDIDKVMWYKQNETGTPIDPARKGKTLKVKKGECLSLIAARYGMHWKTIWNHPENDALKNKTRNPNILDVGQFIFVPDHETKKYTIHTDNIHKFVKLGAKTKVKFKLMRHFKERKALDFLITTDCKEKITGTTDSDGFVNISVHPKCRALVLEIKDDWGIEKYEIKLNALTLYEQDNGKKQRLDNLSGTNEMKLREKASFDKSIAVFQYLNDMELTGNMDKTTEDKLFKTHIS